jgi:hypothetical protein
MVVAQAKARHGAGAKRDGGRRSTIVLYDSCVQSSFHELVEFVSRSRYLIRKAKLAAKVALIKRMAELGITIPRMTKRHSTGSGSDTTGSNPSFAFHDQFAFPPSPLYFP